MKFFLIVIICCCLVSVVDAQKKHNFDLQVVTEFSTGSELGSLRAIPVNVSKSDKAILLIF